MSDIEIQLFERDRPRLTALKRTAALFQGECIGQLFVSLANVYELITKDIN